MKQLIFFSLAFSILFLTSCVQDKDSIISPIDLLTSTYDNIPVKVNTANSFTFTVSGKNLTYNSEDILNFDADSLVFTLTLTNASSSNSTMELFDEGGNQIFSESLNSNKVIVNPNIQGIIPRKIMIDLVRFTGQLTIVIAIDKS